MGSICKYCGLSISWARIQPSGRLRPFDELGGVMVIGRDGFAKYALSYREHHCNEDDVQAYETDQEARLARQEANDAARVDIQETKRLSNEQALGFACPKCGVGVGEVCENLTERRKGNQVGTEWPHSQRLPERTLDL